MQSTSEVLGVSEDSQVPIWVCEFHPLISLKVGLRHLKQVAPNGWNACKICEGNMTMSNPNYIASLSASIITCDPYPFKIKRW